MADLSNVETKELRSEIARREREDREEFQRQINERFGPCPECGADIRELSTEVTREHWQAKPGWEQVAASGLELEFWQRDLIGREIETKIVCANGHDRYEQEIKFAATQEP